MFAYCSNNPIMYTDPSGNIPVLIAGVIAVLAIGGLIGLDHYLAAEHPDGFELYEETPFKGTRIRYGYADGNGFECGDNGITICDVDVGAIEATYVADNLEVTYGKVLSASATADFDWSGKIAIDCSAVASIYSTSSEFTLSLPRIDVVFNGELHLGAIGGGIEFDYDEGKFGLTLPSIGIVPSFDVDFEFNSAS